MENKNIIKELEELNIFESEINVIDSIANFGNYVYHFSIFESKIIISSIKDDELTEFYNSDFKNLCAGVLIECLESEIQQQDKIENLINFKVLY